MEDGFKHDIAIGITSELSQRFSEQVSAAKTESIQAEGAMQACALGAQRIQQLSQQLDGDQDSMSPEEYASAKRWVNRCYGAMVSLQNQVEIKTHILSGKAMGLEQAMQQTQKELAKHEERKRPPVEADEDDAKRARSRKTGTHPENPMEARREEEVLDEVDSSPVIQEDVSAIKTKMDDLRNHNKRELVDMIKALGLSPHGTKRDLIERIVNGNAG